MKNQESVPWRVFISSTKEDLTEYREAAEKTLVGMEQVPLGMEYFVSSPDKPLDVCLSTVRRSQLFIVIVGMRYGSIEEGSGKSYTELEYDEALKNKIPILAFIIDEEQCPVLPKYVDTGEKAEKLKAFKDRLTSAYLVSRFISVDNLKQLIESSVRKAVEKITADRIEKEASESQVPVLTDYIEGAKRARRFILLPKRYRGQVVTLRVRMDGLFGTWKVKDEIFTAFGLDPGDTLFGNDAAIIGIDSDDIDERARTLDFLAGGSAADWVLDNEITTGTIFEGSFRLAYEKVDNITSRRSGDSAVYIAVLILVEGRTVIGKDSKRRKTKSISTDLLDLLIQ